jgi:ketosteroid isomerase-like protein
LSLGGQVVVREGSWMNRLWVGALLAALALTGGLFAACGDDDSTSGPTDTPAPTQKPDVANAQAVVQAFADAWNAADAEAVLLRFTDDGLKAFFQDDTVTRDTVRQNAGGFLRPPFEITDFPNTVVTGDTATVEVRTIEGGGTVSGSKYLLVRQGEDWRINGRKPLVTEASTTGTPAPP